MVTAINFSAGMNFFALMYVMPLFSMNAMNLKEGLAGIVTGMFLFGVLSARFFSGRYIHDIGYKRLLSIGLIGMAVVSILYFFVNGLVMLLIVRFLNGFTFSVISTTNITIVTNIIPKERSGEGIGYYSMGQIFAMAIGPFFSITFGANGNFNAVFAIAMALPMASTILLPFINLKNVEFDKPKGKTTFVKQFFETKALPIGIFSAIVIISNGTSISFLSVFAKQFDMVTIASIYPILTAVVSIVTRPLFSKRFDKKGANAVCYPAIICFIIGWIIMSLKGQDGIFLLIAAIPIGTATGAIQMACLAIVMSLVPRDRLSVGNATYYAMIDLAAAMGPVMAGALLPIFGFGGLFNITLTVGVLCIPLYYLLHGRKRIMPEK